MKNVGDIIEFEGKKYLVLTNFSDDGKDYSFVNEYDETSDDVIDAYIIIEYSFDGTFDKVSDPEVLDKIYPKLQEGLKLEYERNGIDLEEVKKEVNEKISEAVAKGGNE